MRFVYLLYPPVAPATYCGYFAIMCVIITHARNSFGAYIKGLHKWISYNRLYSHTLSLRINMLGRNQQVQVKMDSNSPSDGKEFGFEWCFKPYIVILKLLTGAPVDRPSTSQKEQQHKSICSCLALYGVMLLIMNASISTNYVKEYISNNIMGQGVNNFPASPWMGQQQHPRLTQECHQ